MLVFTENAILRLLTRAVNNKSWIVLSALMNDLAGQYIEGLDETAGKLFNTTWAKLPNEAKNVIINEMPFESCANDLARKNGLKFPYKQTGEFTYEYVGFLKDPRWFSK